MTQAVKLAQLGSPGISTGFKNRIINGAMVIDQRNAGASISATDGSFSVDRWRNWQNSGSGSKGNAGQNLNSASLPIGFNKYLGFQTTSAYSVSGTDAYGFQHRPEGFNFVDLNWGSANAKTVTLSFWVQSSLTGTFGGAIRDTAGAASYPFSYTISSANTWEQKSITITGATTGTWGTTNNLWGYINFSLGTASGVSASAGSWTAGSYWSATGATSVVGTNGATFYITGVQLEVGTTATDFEYRDYGRELMMCQRYCYRFLGNSGYEATPFMGQAYSTTRTYWTWAFPVPMRATPTFSYSNLRVDNFSGGWTATYASLDSAASRLAVFGFCDVGSAVLTQYRPYTILANATTDAYVILSAEL